MDSVFKGAAYHRMWWSTYAAPLFFSGAFFFTEGLDPVERLPFLAGACLSADFLLAVWRLIDLSTFSSSA